MARTTIFPTQEVAFSYSFMGAFPAESITPAPFTLELGKTYAVQWGDTLFENLSVIDLADAGFTGGAIGNGSILDFPGNNEPFVIAYFSDDISEIMILFLDDSESQTITVYLEDAGGGGGEEETTNPIVLKDRTGTDIEYEGVEGVRVFDKDGNPHVFVPPVEREEKTVELDFSGGAMEVTPTAGKVLSKVGIPVPENLLPENIAKDVDIAGVVGTHEGGGGAVVPFIFAVSASNFVILNNSNGANTVTATVNIPLNAIINSLSRGSASSFSSSSSAKRTGGISNDNSATSDVATNAASYTMEDGTSNGKACKKIRASATYTNTSSQKYGYAVVELLATFQIPGITQKNENGNVVLHGDDSVSEWPYYGFVGGTEYADIVDLRETSITAMPISMITGSVKLKELRLPPTIKSVAYPCIQTFADEPLVIDMSNFTAVPSLSYSSSSPTFSAKSGLQILVPASLYDEWIAKSGWTNYASYIVPV